MRLGTTFPLRAVYRSPRGVGIYWSVKPRAVTRIGVGLLISIALRDAWKSINERIWVPPREAQIYRTSYWSIKSFVVSLTPELITDNERSGFDFGEKAWEFAFTSKEGSRPGNYSISIRWNSDEQYQNRGFYPLYLEWVQFKTINE